VSRKIDAGAARRPIGVFFGKAEVAAPYSLRTAAIGIDWLGAPSRFVAWSRPAAIFALLLLALVELTGLLTQPVPMKTGLAGQVQAADSARSDERDHDLVLYDRIIQGIRDGGNYYSVAARELRAGGYPLRPFVAFRPPLLAELLARISPLAGLLLLRALIAATILAWGFRLREATGSTAAWSIACLLLIGGIALYAQAEYAVVHEVWAGTLIALSLALRDERRWLAAVTVGLLALLIRELTLPYVAIMTAAALYERKWREAAGWTAAIGVFAVAIGLHAVAASAVVSAADVASPGWSRLGGWRFFLTATWLTGPLRVGPYLSVATLAPLAVIGWAGWRAPIAARAFATLIAYAAMLMAFGRPDNFYWALMFTPLLMVGLAFAPRSLNELVVSVRRGPKSRERGDRSRET
jgi:hypothetical protein